MGKRCRRLRLQPNHPLRRTPRYQLMMSRMLRTTKGRMIVRRVDHSRRARQPQLLIQLQRKPRLSLLLTRWQSSCEKRLACWSPSEGSRPEVCWRWPLWAVWWVCATGWRCHSCSSTSTSRWRTRPGADQGWIGVVQRCFTGIPTIRPCWARTQWSLSSPWRGWLLLTIASLGAGTTLWSITTPVDPCVAACKEVALSWLARKVWSCWAILRRCSTVAWSLELQSCRGGRKSSRRCQWTSESSWRAKINWKDLSSLPTCLEIDPSGNECGGHMGDLTAFAGKNTKQWQDLEQAGYVVVSIDVLHGMDLHDPAV